MGICGSIEGLKSILTGPQTTPAATQTESGIAASQSARSGNQATLSSVENAASLTATGSGVRADKVAEIQIALAAGTYHVPASAVASKVVDAMCDESAAEAVREPARIQPRTNATAGARGEWPGGQFTLHSASYRGLLTPIRPLNIVFRNAANATVDTTQSVSDAKTLSAALNCVSSSS
jgi:anti-sigma28 factor (negative regulator of flagellin synthesis)